MRIFYSWQSDLPNKTNRTLIGEALELASKAVRNDPKIEIEPVIDLDTLGVAGSPDIANTIFQKIDEADAIVSDVSIVNSDNGRAFPNPNVLIELGYARKAFGGWDRIILVLNTEYGGPELLPFDLRGKRCTTYQMSAGATDKAETRRKLSRVFEEAIRIIASLPARAQARLKLAGRRIDLFREVNLDRTRTTNRWFRVVAQILNSGLEPATFSTFKLLQNGSQVGTFTSRPGHTIPIRNGVTNVPIAAGIEVSPNHLPRSQGKEALVITCYFMGSGRLDIHEEGPFALVAVGLDNEDYSSNDISDVRIDLQALTEPDYC